ncbi:hypothetical protein [Herpetosiphon geysericola]|uniref:Uncharacterized protein n=1 Tax=Herpetosiphon geysericola TaxID=70996 RepID=A0A0P6Z183_9CHLR|nr:hypothetical protein [Herpetosiphon geysericola]KPL90745.1 hypothetical protein SE18_05095 [Herpetosiphon geysericola]
MPAKHRRRRWPIYAEGYRRETLQLAQTSKKKVYAARMLLRDAIGGGLHRTHPDKAELIATRVLVLLAEIETDQVSIARNMEAASIAAEDDPAL